MAKQKDQPGNRPDDDTEGGDRRQRRWDRRTFIRTGLAVGGGLVAAAYVKPNLQSIGVPRAFANVTPPPPPIDGLCIPINVDFGGLSAGAIVGFVNGETDNSNASIPGITIITIPTNPKGNGGEPMIYFSSPATTADLSGQDTDLGTPNVDFGGPGVGSGGGAGMPGANKRALGNILIISEDGDSNDPDDDADGGKIIFRFDQLVRALSVDLLDIDRNEPGGMIKLYGPDGSGIASPSGLSDAKFIKGFDGLPLSNNSFQCVKFGAEGEPGVKELHVCLPSSGAVPELAYCIDEP